jgi:branched-chain amino acid transport system substrate-binding protein
MILRGIAKVKGNMSDKAALVKAMHSVDMSDAPRGPIHLDQYNAAVENVYIRVVASGQDGKLYNKGLFTIKGVTQFGPYDPQIYLKQPPDTGKYPPESRSALPAEMLKVKKEYTVLPFGK